MKPLEWKSKRPSLLKKHKRSLTIMGAAIVFLTYAIKEVWRDELKDKRDGLENAITFYDLKLDQLPNQPQVDQKLSAALIQTGQFTASRNEYPNYSDDPLSKQLQLLDIEVSQLQEMENAIDLLKSHIPEYNTFWASSVLEYRKTFEVAKEERNKARLGAFEGVFASKLPATATDDDLAKKQTERIDALETYETNMIRLADDAFYYGEHVRLDAEETKTIVTLRYEFVNVVSYFFFAIGWALGLAGRLFGSEDVVGGED